MCIFLYKNGYIRVHKHRSIVFFLFYTFYRLHAKFRPLKKEVLKMQNRIVLENPNDFGVQNILHILTKKMQNHT